MRVSVKRALDRRVETVQHLTGELVRTHVGAHVVYFFVGKRVLLSGSDGDVEDIPVGIILGAQEDFVEMVIAVASS